MTDRELPLKSGRRRALRSMFEQAMTGRRHGRIRDWWRCPEHVPWCIGPDCCCNDLHPRGRNRMTDSERELRDEGAILSIEGKPFSRPSYELGRKHERAQIVAYLKSRGAHGQIAFSQAAYDLGEAIEKGEHDD